MSLIVDPQGEYAMLSVSDDGAGFIDDGSSKRHGLALVKRLVEQIKGVVTLDFRSWHQVDLLSGAGELIGSCVQFDPLAAAMPAVCDRDIKLLTNSARRIAAATPFKLDRPDDQGNDCRGRPPDCRHAEGRSCGKRV